MCLRLTVSKSVPDAMSTSLSISPSRRTVLNFTARRPAIRPSVPGIRPPPPAPRTGSHPLREVTADLKFRESGRPLGPHLADQRAASTALPSVQ